VFQDISYKSILKRMLDRIQNNFDKREGSIIYDALAPCAMELMNMYISLNTVLKETFGDTASRDFLILRAKERGLSPELATHAILKALTTHKDIDIKIGSRFSLDVLNYVVTEKIKDGEYKVKCESLGRVGNSYYGEMISIDYIRGLEKIEIVELLIPGEDEEDTEVFRKRYLNSFDSKAFGGNVADYLNKTNIIAGVGCTKVTPVWDGGGTVKLTILDSDFNKASKTLIETVQSIIDPSMDAAGIGIAPIGHIVTVDTVEEVSININVSILFDEDYTFDNIESTIKSILSEYLLEIRKEWHSKTTSIVRIAQIESRILSIEGVIDILNTKINGDKSNFVLSEFQIPVLGDVENEER